MVLDQAQTITSRILRGTVTVAVFRVLIYVVSVVMTVIVARRLDPASMGVVALMNFVLGIVGVFSNFGTSTTVVSRVSVSIGSKNSPKPTVQSGYGLRLVLGLFLGALLFVVAAPVSDMLQEPRLVPMLYVAALSILISNVFGLSTILFQAFQQMVLYSIFSLMSTVVSLVSVTVLLEAGFSEVSVPLASLVSGLLVGLVATIAFFRKTALHIGLTLSPPFWSEAKTLLRMGGFLVAGSFISMLCSGISLLFVQTYCGSEATGYLGVATSLSTVIGFAVSPLLIMLYPVVGELWGRGSKKELEETIVTFTRYVAIATIPPALVLGLLSEQMLTLVFSSKYVPASSIILALALQAAFVNTGVVFGALITAANKLGIATKISIVFLPVNAILSYLFIPRLGLEGVAIPVIVVGVGNFVLAVFLISRALGLRVLRSLGGVFLKVAVVSSILVTTLFLVSSSLPFPALICVCLALYMGSIWVTRSFTIQDLRELKKALGLPSFKACSRDRRS